MDDLTQLNFNILPHRIYSKDEYGRVLADCEFPERSKGEYVVTTVYVNDDLSGMAQIADQMMNLALSQVQKTGGRFVAAQDQYGGDWLRKKGLLTQ
ncbi:MAG: hypothetical protein PUC46_04640 [Lachnospiraceae bacterium]|nr:hypothetical protein [Lachnospiraceae bacterium]